MHVHLSSILDSGAKHIISHLSTHAKHLTHFNSIFEHFSVINLCSSFISHFRNHFVDELNQISRCSFYSAHLIISCIPATPSCAPRHKQTKVDVSAKAQLDFGCLQRPPVVMMVIATPQYAILREWRGLYLNTSPIDV